jgi:hypothetical protein
MKRNMKKQIYFFLSLGILAGMMLMASCGNGDDDQLTPQQEQAQLLSGTWTQQNTTNRPEGVDPAILDDLTITFNVDGNRNPTTFSSSGAPDFFATTSSSEWAFSGSSTTSVILSDVAPVDAFTINSLTANSLTITFTLSGSGLRVASLDGNYTVELTK